MCQLGHCYLLAQAAIGSVNSGALSFESSSTLLPGPEEQCKCGTRDRVHISVITRVYGQAQLESHDLLTCSCRSTCNCVGFKVAAAVHVLPRSTPAS